MRPRSSRWSTAVVAEHGRLDLMFNNAGISLLGETQDLPLEQWNAIIDVNIRGVVHGVAAAYPVMIKQGSGHIVNTASMGGLMAAGLLTSYVMTKHAVVGLSLALRSEAAAYGVGVTAICPAAVNTPILDKGQFGVVRGRDFFLKGQGIRKPVDPDRPGAAGADGDREERRARHRAGAGPHGPPAATTGAQVHPEAVDQVHRQAAQVGRSALRIRPCRRGCS